MLQDLLLLSYRTGLYHFYRCRANATFTKVFHRNNCRLRAELSIGQIRGVHTTARVHIAKLINRRDQFSFLRALTSTGNESGTIIKPLCRTSFRDRIRRDYYVVEATRSHG
jgi:hypothetical protein